METIEWPIKNQNANYKKEENSSKETSINISKEIYTMLGSVPNEAIITVKLRKQDFLKAFSNLISNLPLYYYKNGIKKATFNSEFFETNYKEINDHFGNNEIIDYKIKIRINDESTVRYYMYRTEGSERFILRDFLIGENSVLIFQKDDNGNVFIMPEIRIKKNEPSLFDGDEEMKEENTDCYSNFMQIIYYGVPGCGKSYCIDSKLKELGITEKEKEEQTKRVVFHPEYTNSDFIGQILPKVEGDAVKYEFTPGPFTEILKKAYENKSKPYALIIEEINRGNAAAIFGELFQLLDRFDKDESETVNNITYNYGWSSYCINNDDMNFYIRKDYNESNAFIPQNSFTANIGLRLPPNLSLFATMNTSDQNVFKLDNAFKRRWDLELVSNDFDFSCDDVDNQNKQLDQCNARIEGFDFTWGAFRAAVNQIISDPDSADDNISFSDKQIGCWFVKNNDRIISSKTFSNKVIEYLWDDVFYDDPTRIFNSDINSLSSIIKLVNDNLTDKIFQPSLIALINQKKEELNELQRINTQKTKEELEGTSTYERTPYIDELERLVKQTAPGYVLNLYRKQYIGIFKEGSAPTEYGQNFVFFEPIPTKNIMKFGFLLKNTPTLETDLKNELNQEVQIEMASKGTARCRIPLKLNDIDELKSRSEVIMKIMKRAYSEYFAK